MSEQVFHATFLDPADLQPREGWLHVRDGQILALEQSAPTGSTPVTDLPGVVVPGLIDAHIHVTFSGELDPVGTLKAETQNEVVLRSLRNLQAHLQAGVTTVRDLGGPFGVSIDLARAVANGLLTGPRIVPSGHNITMTGGHGYAFGREADGADAVRQAARKELKAGARVVKFMATGGVLTSVPGA